MFKTSNLIFVVLEATLVLRSRNAKKRASYIFLKSQTSPSNTN